MRQKSSTPLHGVRYKVWNNKMTRDPEIERLMRGDSWVLIWSKSTNNDHVTFCCHRPPMRSLDLLSHDNLFVNEVGYIPQNFLRQYDLFSAFYRFHEPTTKIITSFCCKKGVSFFISIITFLSFVTLKRIWTLDFTIPVENQAQMWS